MSTTALTKNESTRRFELNVDDKPAFIVYEPLGDSVLALTHTEVDPALEGKGVGSKLVEETLQYVDKQGMRVVSMCPFVSAYIKRHPGWKRLLADDNAVA